MAAFEQEYADFVGARACVGVGNGTDALEMALRAVGVGHGDEVVLPANTFIATAEAVLRAGARPVFVDVDDEALLIDPPRSKRPSPSARPPSSPSTSTDRWRRSSGFRPSLADRGIAVVEDGAQSQGAIRHGQVRRNLRHRRRRRASTRARTSAPTATGVR